MTTPKLVKNDLRKLKKIAKGIQAGNLKLSDYYAFVTLMENKYKTKWRDLRPQPKQNALQLPKCKMCGANHFPETECLRFDGIKPLMQQKGITPLFRSDENPLLD